MCINLHLLFIYLENNVKCTGPRGETPLEETRDGSEDTQDQTFSPSVCHEGNVIDKKFVLGRSHDQYFSK